ncbi:MAG: Mce/MlaD family protein [Planctomycetota bacterium]|jgi:ABC-type transporter Mla subunit MlaD
MASLNERTRNNVRAGIFVSVSILMAVTAVIVLTDAWRALFQPTHEYTVIFEVSDGVQNLKSGANVLIGGMLMGEVAEVAPRTEQRAFEQIEVTLAVSRDIELYEGAEIAIGSAIIGDNAWIEVSSVGNPDAGEPHDRQFIGISAPILGGLLGAVSADDTESMVRDFQGTARNVRELTERVNTQDWPRWADRIDVVTEWAARAAVDFDAVFQDGRDLLAEYKNLVAENRPNIDAAIENIKVGTGDAREVARRVREETVDKVHNFLDTGQAGVDTANEIVGKVNRDYDVWEPDIRDALAAARLSGQQLKLFATELRRSPWKLLYRPQREEFEHELLYEATRSFAMAASDLKAASESVQRITDARGADIQLDEQTRKLVNDMLRDAIERYQASQERLAAVLFTQYEAP